MGEIFLLFSFPLFHLFLYCQNGISFIYFLFHLLLFQSFCLLFSFYIPFIELREQNLFWVKTKKYIHIDFEACFVFQPFEYFFHRLFLVLLVRYQLFWVHQRSEGSVFIAFSWLPPFALTPSKLWVLELVQPSFI